jgi:hypothetical protein
MVLFIDLSPFERPSIGLQRGIRGSFRLHYSRDEIFSDALAITCSTRKRDPIIATFEFFHNHAVIKARALA